MPRPELEVRCFSPVANQDGDEKLLFSVAGKDKAVSLKIGGLTRQLVDSLPSKSLDLLEIAGLVYGVDAAVSRGGLTLNQLGRDWYRHFKIEMPVRDPDLWNSPDLKTALEETLGFLSDDRFEFTFIAGDHHHVKSPWFDFQPDDGWQADRVLMFSGGLDSFAGALEEVMEQRNRVALVSHFSATKIAPVQRKLAQAIAEKEGYRSVRHFPMQIQLKRGTHREPTHRSRSFLFAVLGLVTAMSFRRDRVSFHENGVVSLNLPPVGNVLGARATRTTHPRVLDGFSKIFSQAFGLEFRVDNPFFWRTKTEVIQTIDRLGMADFVRVTSSCADTHNRTLQHPHCGRCSQCVDRRVAALAAGLEHEDPSEAYAHDLMEAPLESARDREMALSFLRNALAFEAMDEASLLTTFPTIVSTVEHLGLEPNVGVKRLSDLLRRHGSAVSNAMRSYVGGSGEGSLPRLFGDLVRAQALGLPQIASLSPDREEDSKTLIVLDQKRQRVTIDGSIELKKGATSSLLIALGELHLQSLGKGLGPFDFPLVQPGILATQLGLESDENLRKRVTRARQALSEKFASAGYPNERAEQIIENVPWHGYRLYPDKVTVRVASED